MLDAHSHSSTQHTAAGIHNRSEKTCCWRPTEFDIYKPNKPSKNKPPCRSDVGNTTVYNFSYHADKFDNRATAAERLVDIKNS